MHKLQDNLKIGITGLGLIGGSLYKSLVENNFKKIFAHTQNTSTLTKIQNDGFCASKELNILENCDVIFVCSPISKTAEMIKTIWDINQKALFVDVASLKSDILREIESSTTCRFIGSHPMAGTENSGFDSSFAELFKDAKWAITPSKFATEADVYLLQTLIEVTGAKAIKISPEEHDKAVAIISHTPMLLAQALVHTALDKNTALLLAASGFRDMTRLALSNKVMAKDMLNLNQKNIKEALELVINNAQKLLNSNIFDKNIDEIIKTRQNLYNPDGKNTH